MSPILRAAIEERLAEMSSRESAIAATRAQKHFKIAKKHGNYSNPWRQVEAVALDELVGVYMNEQAERET